MEDRYSRGCFGFTPSSTHDSRCGRSWRAVRLPAGLQAVRSHTRKGLDAFRFAADYEQLISTFESGGTARQLNALIADNRDGEQLGKALEHFRYCAAGDLRVVGDIRGHETALATVNGYRRTVAEQGCQMREGNVPQVNERTALEHCKRRLEHTFQVSRRIGS